MFQSSARKQQATYWGNPQTSGIGSKTFDAPIIIAVRWEDNTSLMIEADNEQYMSKAVVYPDRTLDTGGRLALGCFTGSPIGNSKAYVIRSYQESRALLGNTSMAKVILTP